MNTALRMRISGSMSLDVVLVGMTTTSASFSQSASPSCKAPGVSTTATCAPSASCVVCNVPPCVSKS